MMRLDLRRIKLIGITHTPNGFEKCVGCYTDYPTIEMKVGTLEQAFARPTIVRYTRSETSDGSERLDPVYAQIKPSITGPLCSRCRGDRQAVRVVRTPVVDTKFWPDREIERSPTNRRNVIGTLNVKAISDRLDDHDRLQRALDLIKEKKR